VSNTILPISCITVESSRPAPSATLNTGDKTALEKLLYPYPIELDFLSSIPYFRIEETTIFVFHLL